MCEADAFILKNGKEEKFMESVDLIKWEGEDEIYLVSIFGEQKILKGRLKLYNNSIRKIFFEGIGETLETRMKELPQAGAKMA
ncbi:MAG: CooT family nickel-binding protein [Deltaproteobacteria bacterium]|nr:CooT family nickel-binding protein [Deltaproteobacteria bacterium]